MAGVVRRDGPREEAARAIANANNGGLTEHEPDEGDYYLLDKVLRILGLDAVPDVPPTEDDWREANRYYEDDPGLLPDVPPDPPAADRQERLTRDVAASIRITREQEVAARPLVKELSRLAADTWPELWAVPLELLAIALQSSGRLVDAADDRARALEDAAEVIARASGRPSFTATFVKSLAQAHREGSVDEFLAGFNGDRAVSEREGASDG